MFNKNDFINWTNNALNSPEAKDFRNSEFNPMKQLENSSEKINNNEEVLKEEESKVQSWKKPDRGLAKIPIIGSAISRARKKIERRALDSQDSYGGGPRNPNLLQRRQAHKEREQFAKTPTPVKPEDTTGKWSN